MTQQLILYPLLLQLLLAILLMFFWKKINTQRVISMLGSLVHLAVSIGVFAYIWNNGTQTVQAGSWEAPFGITFIADTFAITMGLLTSMGVKLGMVVVLGLLSKYSRIQS